MNDWTDWNQQLFEMIGRCRSRSGSGSKAGSSSTLPEARVWEMDNNGVIISKPLKKVVNIIGEAKAEQEQEKEPIVIDLQQKSKAGVTKYYYDKSIPSNTEQLHKCGLHDFETKSITEFNQHVQNHSSKAASSVADAGINVNNKAQVIADFLNAKHY